MSRKKRFDSVWDAIEDTPQQAASMRARAELLTALQAWVKLSGRTQAEAARLFGITQPRMSDLMRGKIDLFSLSALMDMATAAGLEPRIAIKKPRKRAGELAEA
ncbi:MAG: XRE family transcriptional regulator [Rhodocyclaceae bacterium]|jgi:predicted XRE-type DNA-binding protein|nr:XRE family transcriptional regulator [Rhodocyclaceae bacterium]MCO5096340.1 XRE family transcriptional regulator [Rhodocyclaceae bacterium]